MSGVVNGRSYTAWYIGACDDTPWLHNVIGILSEAASVRRRLARSTSSRPRSPTSFYEKRMDFVDPWPGGWWRLRDIVDYELALSKSLIKTAALHKEDLLFNFYQMYKNSIEKVDKGQPYAFVIPAKQHDYPTMLKMLDVLMMGGVEIHQAKADFVAGGKLYPRRLVRRQDGPALQDLTPGPCSRSRNTPTCGSIPGGPPSPPYDNAGWTLPLQMGVACDQIDEPFEAKLEKIDKVPYPKVPAGQGRAPMSSSTRRSTPPMPSPSPCSRTPRPRSGGPRPRRSKKGLDIPAGSFIVKNSPEVKKALPALLEKYHLAVLDLDDVADIAKAPVKFHRVGLFQSWRGNMDEGWTRYVFDDMGIPYKTLHNEDIKGTKEKKADLRADYDVIVFADENANTIKRDARPGGGRRRGGGPGGPARRVAHGPDVPARRRPARIRGRHRPGRRGRPEGLRREGRHPRAAQRRLRAGHQRIRRPGPQRPPGRGPDELLLPDLDPAGSSSTTRRPSATACPRKPRPCSSTAWPWTPSRRPSIGTAKSWRPIPRTTSC